MNSRFRCFLDFARRAGVFGFFLACAAPLPAVIVLSEDFSDNDRTNQALPGSSAWFFTRNSTSSTLAVSSAALVMSRGGTSTATHILTYFTASGSPVSLQDGETLTISFDLTASVVNNEQNAFQIGVYHSNSSRISNDVSNSLAASAFNNYRGYRASFSAGASSSNNYSLYERTGSSTQLQLSGAHSTLGDANTQAINASANTPFAVNFSLARVGDGLIFTSEVNGITISRTDAVDAFFNFDTLSITTTMAALGANGTLTLDNLVITLVPEPSLSLLSLLGLSGLLLHRRRVAFWSAPA